MTQCSLGVIARQAAPVDKLLWLKARATCMRRNEAAILLSSEAGNIMFWSIHRLPYIQGAYAN